jgi:non-specific serine/threonine protein kinase
LNNLGAQALERGDLQHAARQFEESLALSRALENWRMAGYALHNLGEVARHQGDFSRAAALYNESLSLFRELKDTWAVSFNLIWLGVATQHLGNHEQAAVYLKESLALCVKLGGKRGIAECLEGLAGIACAQRQAARAVRLFGAADALRTAMSSPLSPVDLAEHECILTEARAELGEKEFASAWIAGRAMTLEQGVEYALAIDEYSRERSDDAASESHPLQDHPNLRDKFRAHA